MYSIKQKANIGDITDMIKYKIRSCRGDVAYISCSESYCCYWHVYKMVFWNMDFNFYLDKLIGDKPVFYSPKMIPFYPNPLPYLKFIKMTCFEDVYHY